MLPSALLAIDIGNTRVHCGLFCGKRLVRRFAFPTVSCRSPSAVARALIRGQKRTTVEGVCIVSVVPRLNRIFREALRQAFGVKVLFATPQTIGITLRGYPARRIGTDRLVNALAAYARCKKACIVVDVGTAITIDAVNVRGEFLGGAIVPGLDLMAEALYRMTERLPRVRLVRQRRAIGRDTRACIRSGLFHGTVGMIDRTVEAIAREMGSRPAIIATGGGVRSVMGHSRAVRRSHPDLTLEGLRMLWERIGG